MVDLRSDTVTQPTAAMRRAMAEAEVGDDVFGEDPTVRRLEKVVAEVLGKEAALFVPSGVMGNQIALRLHTRPGDEVVVAERSHLYHYEGGAPAALWGVQLRPIGGPSGVLSPDDVEAVVRGDVDWEPRTTLVCLENTVNKAGGVVVPPEAIAPVADVARRHGLALHLDGARLWNAAAALDLPAHVLAAPFDTVTVCLSKGLGAPVGSVLAGGAAHVREARRTRKLLGGGMRQVGVLAAAGLVALDDRDRLADDHARAGRLADAVAALPAFRLVTRPQSNIVLFDTLRHPAPDVVARLEAEGVRVVAFGPRTVRATLHRDVDDAALDRAVAVLRRLFS
ncbi:GntG family PLP-dependent aldolase [Rubrivirga sp. S365]|nr:GntG family PLP-dependent aldolase [Rubrivirga sp. S365]MDT7857643.1 GntG family PLP-dependent aldolase [Rubrivirga sp. S365]